MATVILTRGLGLVIASVTTDAATTGTNVDLGFIPAMAKGFDVTNGLIQWYWNQGMSSFQTGASAVVFGLISTTSGGVAQYATIGAGAGGITALDGSAGTAIGLNIGTNTVINIASHAILVEAWEPH